MFKKYKYLPLLLMLCATGLFNVLDYFFTLRVIGPHTAYVEGNPVMNALLHTPMFPIYKLLIVPSLLALIWFLRKEVGKRIMLYAGMVFVMYFFLMIYFGGIFLS